MDDNKTLRDFLPSSVSSNIFAGDITSEKIEYLRSMSTLRDKVTALLKCLRDPELSVNILDLGLIYDLRIDEVKSSVEIDLTLTTPACPVAESMPVAVKSCVESVLFCKNVLVNLVWDPPWDKSMMSEEARLELDMFD